VLFLTAAASIVAGGPLALLALGWLFDAGKLDSAWRGLAAMCGSWIGGGANFTAIGRSVEMPAEIYGVMVVVDVAIANLWMVALLYFADRHREMDARIGADARAVDAARAAAEE